MDETRTGKSKIKDLSGTLADYTQSIKLKDQHGMVLALRGDLMIDCV